MDDGYKIVNVSVRYEYGRGSSKKFKTKKTNMKEVIPSVLDHEKHRSLGRSGVRGITITFAPNQDYPEI